ncbi:MAG: DUF4383 domain-containing protein [Propylenella sp.]
MNTRTAGLVIGIVFILVGILGFIPNPIVSPTGLFVVNTAHNLVHLISGAVVLAGVYSFGAGLGLKIIGVVYAIVAILGLVMGGEMLLGMIAMNMADHWLHVVLAVVILLAGFALPDDKAAATA